MCLIETNTGGASGIHKACGDRFTGRPDIEYPVCGFQHWGVLGYPCVPDSVVSETTFRSALESSQSQASGRDEITSTVTQLQSEIETIAHGSKW